MKRFQHVARGVGILTLLACLVCLGCAGPKPKPGEVFPCAADSKIEKSIAPQISVRNFHLGWAEDYGYLWWLQEYTVGDTTYPTFKALGWGGQEIWVLPESDMVVVFTGANYTVNPPCDELMVSYVLPAVGGAGGG